MGKRARARARNRDRGGQPGPKRDPVDTAELVQKLESEIDAEIRLLRAGDAAAEPLRPLIAAGKAGMPVALIEPVRAVLIQDDGGIYDVRIAVATKMGLPLAGPTASRLAPGWTFGPRQGKWELTDPTGTIIARSKVSAGDSAKEPAWTTQAITAGQILIAYGTQVGVRVPGGVPASRYDDQYRAAELRQSLAGQRACVAIVGLPQQIAAFRSTRSS